jgi:DnaJ-class molecular chaperone
MSDTTLTAQTTEAAKTATANVHVHAHADCDECLGSGGWYRYEPALDPAPGLLYLSCLQCRGSGRTAQARG